MIKKIIITGCLSVLIFAACKKDRTCTCTVSRTGTSTTTAKVTQVIFGFPIDLADTAFITPVYDIQLIDKKMTNVTKKTAGSNCISYTQPYSETNLTSVPASSFNLSISITNKGEEKYDCKLK